MGILLAFSPFGVFILVQRLASVEAALLAASAASLLLTIKDVLISRKSPKVLEVGTVLLFVALAIYGWFGGALWSIAAVRLAVDAGLLLIVLLSIAIGQPFTLQYARESVPESVWNQPAFRRANLVITTVWAAAFTVMVSIDLTWLLVPELPARVVIIVTVLALLGAVKFTGWYPERQRAVRYSCRRACWDRWPENQTIWPRHS